MSLLRLPNELLLIILHFAFPEALVNLVLTCKRFFLLADSFLQDHRWYMENIPPADGHDESKQFLDIHPFQVIRLILEGPKVAFYIRYLICPSPDLWSHFNKCNWDEDIAAAGSDDQFRRSLEKKLEEAGCRKGHVDSRFLRLPGNGLSPLLVLLPQLRKLHLSGSDEINEISMDLIGLIRQQSIFQHLLTVRLSWDEDFAGNSEDVINLSCWAGLPAIRYLTVERMSDSASEYEWYHDHPCKVTCVDFQQCHLNIGTIEAIINPIENLQDFSYEDRWLTLSSIDGPKMFYWIVEALETMAASTLKRIRLAHRDDGNSMSYWNANHVSIDDLTTFTALQSLDISSICLIKCALKDPPDEDSPHDRNDCDEFGLPFSTDTISIVPRLADILPPSIEKLRLTFMGNPATQCARLFEGLFLQDHDHDHDISSGPSSRLPKLVNLQLACTETEFPNERLDLLRRAAVKVSFEKSKSYEYEPRR